MEAVRSSERSDRAYSPARSNNSEDVAAFFLGGGGWGRNLKVLQQLVDGPGLPGYDRVMLEVLEFSNNLCLHQFVLDRLTLEDIPRVHDLSKRR
jgi:hypothetical protein